MSRLAILLLALGLGVVPPVGADEFVHRYPATLTNIVDADTMDVELDMGLGVEMDVRLRVQDYDAPETWRPSTEMERTHGMEATAYTKEILTETFIVTSYGWAIYNRVGGDITLPDGRDYATIMREAGYTKRPHYTDE